MGIINNLDYYIRRKKINKNTKYMQSSHLSSREPRKRLYDYYVCDYCNSEIEIFKKRYEMTGGEVTIPASLTGKSPVVLMLCNRCLKKVLNEFEESRSGENHIPRID